MSYIVTVRIQPQDIDTPQSIARLMQQTLDAIGTGLPGLYPEILNVQPENER